MAFVNMNSRRSTDNYRFSVIDKNDPALAELRRVIAKENKFKRRYNASEWCTKPLTLKRVCVKGRGPRPRGYNFHTPSEFATHFDVYVSNRY